MVKGNESRVARLAAKRLHGRITPAENNELQGYFLEDPRLEPFINQVYSPEQLKASRRILLDMDSDAIRAKVEKKIHGVF